MKIEGGDMNTVISEVDGLIAEMKALDKFNDDVFIQQPRDPRGLRSPRF